MKTVKQRLAIWTAVSKPDKRKASDPDVKDKYSLKDQELLGVAFADAGDYEIVKIFRWPGHSRDESDVVQALEDFEKAGRLEYRELREMWRAHAFDVLWCHNHSRLGRSFTLQSWVIENVIRSGARIYRHVGGWINADDYGGQIALGGWANTQERGRRLEQNNAGLTKRAEKGLNLNHVPFPHRLIRDPEDGKALRMEIDPKNRLFLDHLYELLMAGTPLKILGRELFIRYGHTNPRTGRAWGDHMLYEMLHRPSFWGNSARKFSNPAAKHALYHECWGFDPTATLPEGVIIYWNTHEPAYTGTQAGDVQSALQYLKRLDGKTPIYKVHSLSGLVFCPECYHQMHYSKSVAKHVTPYYYLHCPVHYEFASHNSTRDCSNTRHIREGVCHEFVEILLKRAFAGEDPAAIFGDVEASIPKARIEHLKEEIDHQNILIDRLYLQSAEFGEQATERSKRLITEAQGHLDQLTSEYQQLTKQESTRTLEHLRQVRAVDELKAIPFDQLWLSDNATVNRLLKDFFGRYALFVLDGQLIGHNLRPQRGKGRGTPYLRE